MQELIAELNAPEPEPPAAPVFKQWKIHKLEDLFAVDADQADKVFYFLQHMLRKARIEKQILIYFIYSEQGGGRVIEVKSKPAKPPVEDEEDIDPLS